jgi:hypothetical protein
MLRCLKIALLATVAFSAASGTIDAQAITGTCASADTTGTRLIGAFTNILTPHIASDTTVQAGLGLIGVTPAQIAIVTDNSVCTRAATALDAYRTVKSTSYTLYVLTVGTSYAVLDRDAIGPGYVVAWVFDHDWKFVAAQQVF